VGQEHITRTLQNAIASERIGHAFLFVGSRGIGKTTTARILAKALNCLSSEKATPNPCGKCDNCLTIAAGNNIDVIEIDGASNNSVDDVRQIREHVRLVPSRSRYKIYVIDEVHQLSLNAFNALLKTLEEPPHHAAFVLATTEAHKLPATIVSRCQRYDFRRVPLAAIIALLRKILDDEGVKCSEEALHAVARAADGGIRDAESILEQLISYCGTNIAYKDVFDVLGLVDWKVYQRLCEGILDNNVASLLGIVEEVVANGKDLSQFVQDALHYLRNLLVCKTADPKELIPAPDEEIAAMGALAERFSVTTLIRLIEQFAELAKDFDSQLAQRIALESLLIRMAKVSVEVSVDSVLEKLAALGAGGAGPSRPGGGTTARKSASGAPAPERVETPTADDGPSREPTPQAVLVTTKNMSKVWRRAAELASERSLNLGVMMGQAHPVGIDRETITVRFANSHARSKIALSRPENLETVNAILSELTQNIAVCRVDAGMDEPEPLETPHADSRSYGGRVSADEAKTALADPHVAKVIEVFRGRVVDVRRAGPGPAGA
jgi:DNA polymerase-3 subunit gamma/tau